MMNSTKYALISVFDKYNIDNIANFLLDQGYNIISTGGTFNYICDRLQNKENRSRIIQVSDFTGFPEILDGRVKSLHPKIYGSLLANRNLPDHIKQLEEHQIPLIDVVIVNLYPFKDAIDKNLPMDQANELIDIGGVSLIRASAKNWQHVTILTSPNDYPDFVNDLVLNKNPNIFRQKLALKAFQLTMTYDLNISNYFQDQDQDQYQDQDQDQDHQVTRQYKRQRTLKYGCNPHQTGASLLVLPGVNKLPFSIFNGNLGYINTLDALNAWQLVNELSQILNTPAVASFKHTSPAGVAVYTKPLTETQLSIYDCANMWHINDSKLAVAFLLARNSDPKSSFGDLIALSHVCDKETALLIKREVSDGLIAPGYTADALEILSSKKGGKYLIIQMDQSYQPPDSAKIEYREMYGIGLSQERNMAIVTKEIFNLASACPTENKTIPESIQIDLLLANLTLKYSQSNNVVLAKDGQVIGVAAGQQSRVDAVKLAGTKAQIWNLRHHPKVQQLCKSFRNDITIKRQDKVNAIIRYIEGDFTNQEYEAWKNLFVKVNANNTNTNIDPITKEEKDAFLITGVSLASDAFFPFRDNIDHASKFGVSYVMQPGGSLADTQVIKACNDYKMSMVLTGKRMFTH